MRELAGDVWLTAMVDGKPAHDRNWKECFGQLKGNVLLLWDAAELDAAEMDVSGRAHEEVVPTFLNLTDASIKMVGGPTLPCTRRKLTTNPRD